MTELIVAVFLAVGVSAVCSLFEAVLYAVPLRHIETMARAGRREGKILKDLRRNVERPISAILSLNTIANTAGAAFAGASAAAAFPAPCGTVLLRAGRLRLRFRLWFRLRLRPRIRRDGHVR